MPPAGAPPPPDVHAAQSPLADPASGGRDALDPRGAGFAACRNGTSFLTPVRSGRRRTARLRRTAAAHSAAGATGDRRIGSRRRTVRTSRRLVGRSQHQDQRMAPLSPRGRWQTASPVRHSSSLTMDAGALAVCRLFIERSRRRLEGTGRREPDRPPAERAPGRQIMQQRSQTAKLS